MDLLLRNKIIIVTGGAKGIGEGISRVMAAEGAVPIIVGRSEEDNRNTVESIEASGNKADAVAAELTLPEECKKAVDWVIMKYNRIDGLVNNAGVNDGVGLAKG